VGQLPIIFVGDFVLTQPLAVVRYLARRCGLAGDTEWEEARAEEVSDLVYDLRLSKCLYL
jgi:glutathione S-transferase